MNEEKLPKYPEGWYSTGDPENIDMHDESPREERAHLAGPIKIEASLRERMEALFEAILLNLKQSEKLDDQLEGMASRVIELKERIFKKIKVNGEMIEAIEKLLKKTREIGYNGRDLGLSVDRLNETIDKIDRERKG